MTWASYGLADAYDELVDASGRPRPHARKLCRFLASLGPKALRERQEAAELALRDMGITFRLYGRGGGSLDRVLPFDVVPRPIPMEEWRAVEAGLKQRLRALNRFIADIYNERRILRFGIVPEELVLGSPQYLKACRGLRPPLGVWAHVCGTDLVRDFDGRFYVLEDNLRVPSGVSYVLENRQVLKRALPELFERQGVEPVDDYPAMLYETLASVSQRRIRRPSVVVLTPGVYNSAYYEHAFLAQQMGALLVEGRDLVVGRDDCVYARTIQGPLRVDVVYRRVDDAFLDPDAFRKDSMVGVPGLFRAWRRGKVTLANAPGTGVADDKAVYVYVPQMIRHYLGEEPILPNVRTYLCSSEEERAYVLENLAALVVKPANASGGYGMLVGPRSSAAERRRFAAMIRRAPRGYVAQPLVRLSTGPTLAGRFLAPRHLDLRPFVLQGRRLYVTPGGLTRVALREGSYVVNSSQGGGTKDTWVVRPD